MFLEYFEKIIETIPNHIAITWGNFTDENPSPQYYLTYAELNRRANQLAWYLKKITRNTSNPTSSQNNALDPVIAIYYDRNKPDWIVSILALWKIGYAALLLDKNLTDAERSHRIHHAGVKLIITDDETHLKSFPHVLCTKDEAVRKAIACELHEAPRIELDATKTAYVAFTSGTTGESRGIALPGSGIMPITLAYQEAIGITPEDRVLQFSSFSFDVCWMEFFKLSLGIRLVLADDIENIVQKLPELIERNKISILTLVPSILKNLDLQKLTSVRGVVSTGEAGSVALFKKLLTLLKLLNGYGPTEATIGSTLTEYKGGPVVLGNPIKGSRLFLLKKKTNQLSNDKKGEIAIAGPGLAKGYILNGQIWQEKTQQSFVEIQDPENPNKSIRVYRTGDLAHYDAENNLIFDGRLDSQIKIYGMRFEASAIATALMSSLPKNSKELCDLVCVVPRHIEAQDHKMIHHLVAIIKFKSDQEDIQIDIKAIRENMLQLGVHKAAIPNEFYVIDTGVFKKNNLLTNSGKVRFKIIEEKIKDPNFTKQLRKLTHTIASEKDTPALTETENKILQLWKNILCLPAETIIDPITDDFFDLGGNSLLGLELAAKLEQMFQVNLQLPPALPKKITLKMLARDITRRIAYTDAWQAVTQNPTDKGKLFLFHPVSGSPSEFKKLQLTCGLSVYGLKDPLLSIDNKSSQEKRDYQDEYYCVSMEECVAYAIYGLRQHQNKGPFYLGGYSFGGIAILEMQAQLAQMNQEITFLALLDPPPPKALCNSLSESGQGIKDIKRIILKISAALDVPIDLRSIEINEQNSPKEKISLLFNATFARLHSLLKEEKIILKQKMLKAALQIFRVTQRNLLALEAYEAKAPAPHRNTVLYLSNDKGYFNDTRTTHGTWENYFSTTPITTITIDAEHLNLLEKPDLSSALNRDIGRTLTLQETKIYEPTNTSYWNLPDDFPFFIGREHELNLLDSNFKTQQPPVPITQAICGFGGAGKTKLAIKYINQYLEQKIYNFILWIDVNDYLLDSVQRFLLECLHIKTDTLSEKNIIDIFYREISKKGKVLVVFDNIEHVSQVNNYLLERRSSGIHILLTSRDAGWPRNYSIVRLTTFTLRESTFFIGQHLRETTAGEREKLAAAVGNYPLLLSQAIAFLTYASKTIPEYIALLDTDLPELLDEPIDETIDRNYHDTMLRVVKISLKNIAENTNYPHITEFLYLICCLHYQNIPVLLLKPLLLACLGGDANAENIHGAITKIELKLERYLEFLNKYQFISESKSATSTRKRQHWEIHPLIQRTVLELLPENKELLQRALDILGFYIPNFNNNEKASITFHKSLYLHLCSFYSVCGRSIKKYSSESCTLILQTAHFVEREENKEWQSGLDLITLITPSVTDRKLSDIEVYLETQRLRAALSRRMTKFQECYDILKETIVFQKTQQRQLDTNLLFELAKTCVYLSAKNKKFAVEARAVLEEIIAVDESGEFFHELGMLHIQQSDYTKAYQYFKKAVDIKTKEYGPSNLQTSISQRYFAIAAAVLGKLKEAKDVISEALNTTIQWDGTDDSPAAMKTLEQKAEILVRCGDYFDATQLFDLLERKGAKGTITFKIRAIIALAYYDQALKTLITAKTAIDDPLANPVVQANYLILCIYEARVFNFTKKHLEAKKSLEEIIDKYNEIYDDAPKHNTLTAKIDLLDTLINLNENTKAEILAGTMLQESVLVYGGKNNAFYARTNYHLGILCIRRNDAKQALVFLNTALTVQKEVFSGLYHPDLAETLRELADIFITQEKLDTARQYLDEASKIQFSAYRTDEHPEAKKTRDIIERLTKTSTEQPVLSLATVASQRGNFRSYSSSSSSSSSSDEKSLSDNSKQPANKFLAM